MNTIPHLAAIVVLIGLATHFFEAAHYPDYLGYTVVFIIVWAFILGIYATLHDISYAMGGQRPEE